MKRTIFLCFLFFFFWGIKVLAIEISSYTYFAINPDGKYKTLYLVPYNEVKCGEKNYISYTGVLGTDVSVNDMVIIRTEGTKYFCYDSKDQTEHLLFDFGLQKGSTYINDFSNISYEVTDVRDTIVNSKNSKLIELQSIEDKSKRDTWIEGVGSVNTGILPFSEFFKDIFLLTNTHTIETTFDSEFFSYHFYPSNQYIKTADMDITVLRWEKKIETEDDYKEYLDWYNAPSDLNAEFIGDTLRVWGRLRTSCSIQSYAACELRDNQVTFKTYRYDDDEADCIGIYKIETRIPGFHRGTYSVKILNKTIELENTESIYSSVNMVEAYSGFPDNTIYDLQGRKIVNGKRKGIYIRNGKIVVVK